MSIYGRTLNNAGTATWGTTNGYNLYLGYAAVINNTSQGDLELYQQYLSHYEPRHGRRELQQRGCFREAPPAQPLPPSTRRSSKPVGTTYLGSGSLAFGSTPMIQGGSVTARRHHLFEHFHESGGDHRSRNHHRRRHSRSHRRQRFWKRHAKHRRVRCQAGRHPRPGQFDIPLTASGTATLAGTPQGNSDRRVHACGWQRIHHPDGGYSIREVFCFHHISQSHPRG